MILMNNFQAEPVELIQQEIAGVEKVIKSGWYILGNEVKNFESAWANRCRVNYAIGVGNGMDAIEIGLRALNIGTGNEVITTPMTAFATVLAIIRAGATPVLADIDPETALLDPVSVERCLSSRTKAALLVHLYGQVKIWIYGVRFVSAPISICWKTAHNLIWPLGEIRSPEFLVPGVLIVFTQPKIWARWVTGGQSSPIQKRQQIRPKYSVTTGNPSVITTQRLA